jgi:hypothetical protein
MASGLEDMRHDLGGGRSGLLRPVDETGRGPVEVGTMGGRHVRRNGRVLAASSLAKVGSGPLVLEEDLDGGCGDPRLDLLPDQGVGNAVVVLLNVDVIVDVDARGGPLAKFVALGRKG